MRGLSITAPKTNYHQYGKLRSGLKAVFLSELKGNLSDDLVIRWKLVKKLGFNFPKLSLKGVEISPLSSCDDY